MSGGTAYVFDPAQTFRSRCNLEMIELEPLADESDLWLVHGLVEDHVRLTGSSRGKKLLDNWDNLLARFVKVMPSDYKRALEEMAQKAERVSPEGEFTAAIPQEAEIASTPQEAGRG
jgi:glutamate synthase (NADPH/NADH) large chain